MKILMISPKIARGAYARPHAMARQLVSRGHQVTLLLVSENSHWHFQEYLWDGVRAVETPHMSYGRLRYGWDPWNTLSRTVFLNRETQEYDLIHCFETRPANIHPAQWFSHKVHIPIITDWNDWYGRQGLVETNRPWWYHLLNFKTIETYYEENYRPKAAGLTAISSALAQRAVDLGVTPERICLIPGGAFLDWFILRTKEECRKRMGFADDIPILGFSSSDSHFDMEIIMAALARTVRKFPAVKLIVTGKAHPGIHQLAHQFGVAENVCFVGYVSFDDLPWYLGCADIFLLPMADLPHNRGRWPNKVGEYMSLGRPTVANPVGDITTLFETHQIGLLAKWDPNDFADKIITLLNQTEFSAELGRNARCTAENEYDWRILVEKLENFYIRILQLEMQTMSFTEFGNKEHYEIR